MSIGFVTDSAHLELRTWIWALLGSSTDRKRLILVIRLRPRSRVASKP
jgi:hypothetical protein